MTKSCGNCANCSKDRPDLWVCEEYGFYYCGAPVKCTPPNDEACELWTNNPKKANTWMKHV